MPNTNEFDVIIIGGGPAGLSAARTAARSGCKTLLFEKLAHAGDLGHPCSGAIAPLPGFVHGQHRQDGLYFPEINLNIPLSLVVGSPSRQRYISPGGIAFQATFPARDNFPIAVIDKSGFLRLMADQAAAAGEGIYGVTRIPFEEERRSLKGLLNIPDGYEVPCYLALGYPKQAATRMKQFEVRLEDKLHVDGW